VNIRNLALLIPIAAAACGDSAPLSPDALRRDEAPLAADAFAQHAPVTAEGYLDGADGVRLLYHVVGTGPDTVVVVSGGPGLSYRYMAPDLAPLAHGRTVVYYDQRGAGRSTLIFDPAQLSIAGHVADLEALRAHFGISSLSLVGHSFGAIIATQYAATYPATTERLVLLNPAPATAAHGATFTENRLARTPPEQQARQGELIGQLLSGTAADPVAACTELFASLFRVYFHDQANVASMRGAWCDVPPAAAANSAFTLLVGIGSIPEDLRPLAASVSAPALVVHATADPIPAASSAAWAGALLNCELLTIDAAGHFPWLEQPVPFFTRVNEFLRRGDIVN
jgi:proline iminopeptidase